MGIRARKRRECSQAQGRLVRCPNDSSNRANPPTHAPGLIVALTPPHTRTVNTAWRRGSTASTKQLGCHRNGGPWAGGRPTGHTPPTHRMGQGGAAHMRHTCFCFFFRCGRVPPHLGLKACGRTKGGSMASSCTKLDGSATSSPFFSKVSFNDASLGAPGATASTEDIWKPALD